jgi:hypothetical protein
MRGPCNIVDPGFDTRPFKEESTMNACRFLVSGIAAALVLGALPTSDALGADDLPLGAEIQRRFGDDVEATNNEVAPLENSALKFTRNIGWGFEPDELAVERAGAMVISKRSWSEARRMRGIVRRGDVMRVFGLRQRAAQLEDDVEPPHREPTLVERFIDEGFPSGAGHWTVEEDWPSHHIFSYTLAANYAPRNPEADPRFVSGARLVAVSNAVTQLRASGRLRISATTLSFSR